MKLMDVILFSLKNIGRQKLRSVLTIFAIVIGAASVSIMLSLATGARDFFYSQFQSTGQLQQIIVSQSPDADFQQAQYTSANDSGIKLDDTIAAKIKAVPHVTGLTPQTGVYVFTNMYLGDKKAPMNNGGISAHEPNGVIKHTLLAGRDLQTSDTQHKILLGKVAADKLGFKNNYAALVGKEVSLETNKGYTGDGATIQQPPQGPQPQYTEPPSIRIPATVVGISGDENSSYGYVTLAWAKGLLSRQRYDMTEADRKANEAAQRNIKPGQSLPPIKMSLVRENDLDRTGYNSFVVAADQTTNVNGVATDIRKLGVGAATAESYIEQQLDMFKIISLILAGIGGISLAVAAIGVINTMVMAILERTREIGVMRACGATRATIRRLFTIEAAALGFLGGVAGIGVGYGLTKIANLLINEQLTTNAIKAQDIITLQPWLILAVIATTTVIGALAGLYPAFPPHGWTRWRLCGTNSCQDSVECGLT